MVSIAIILVLNKSFTDIRPKFRALVVPPGLGAANISHCDRAAGCKKCFE